MNNSISKKTKYLQILLCILFFNFSYGQLSSFTLQLTATNESCVGNATLSFSVAGQTAGSTILYSIYRLPDVTTPITVTSSNSFTGLVAGNYRVIASQTLGALSNSQQQDITISSQIISLTFDLVGENEVCGNDGKIIVNVTQGTVVSYEIFSGPMIRPLQASNVFSGLTAGLYQVRAFDSCGEGVVRSYVVSHITPEVIISTPNNIEFVDCNNTIEHQSFGHSSTTDIIYPLEVECTVFPPGGGAPLVYNQTISGPNRANNCYFYSQLMPLYAYQYYTYNVKVTDRCGNVYTNNNVVVDSDITPIFMKSATCNTYDVAYYPALSATILSAPITFTENLPYNFLSNGIGVNVSNLPPGNYSFEVVDICGNVIIENKQLLPPNISVYFNFIEGCEIRMSQIFSSGSLLQSAIITSAPSTYQNSIPNDVTNSISNGHLMINLPGGNYTFQVLDVCGDTTTHAVSTQGYSEVTTVNLIRHCDSFDFNFSHSSNYTGGNTYFWLQKRNALTGQWGHPVTGIVYPSNTSPNIFNSMFINNNSITTNIVGIGSYRIVKSDDRGGVFFCTRIIKEFEYSTEPKINNLYSFTCPNGTYEVIVDATGLAPLIYRITTKNGLPFLIDNGTLSLFTGLSPAIYNFQVEDACGNITNRLFEINAQFVFPITASGLCGGQVGSLSVPNFSFLHYEWWKDNNTSTILSTSNSLQFIPFNMATDFGTYHVRVTNPGNPNSCINFVLDYIISTSMSNPNAGNDSSISYCGNQGTINLFSLLSGVYDANGVWEEVTNSGTLVNNSWNSTSVAPGTYSFRYRVDGFCSSFDESQVDITIKKVPQTPVASADPIACDSGVFYLYASSIPGVTYHWTGPNGFISNEQNPIINNVSSSNVGTYSVSIFENGCESGITSVNLTISGSPEVIINRTCENNATFLYASSVNNSFHESDVTYSWTGPDGYTQVGNPINITGNGEGVYYVTVINSIGCSNTDSVEVACTFCGIPKGVSANDDNQNDTFDLSCLEGVQNVKIYNRYGTMVFEQDNYVDQWKGYDYRGILLPTATYYYVIQFKSGESKTGWVYLNY